MCFKINFPFRLITFDATNTLLHFKLNIGKTYGKIGEKYGIKCDAEKLTKNFKHEFKKMDQTNPIYGLNDIKWRKWWKIVVFETFKRTLNQDVNDVKLDKIYENLVEMYKTSECWQPAPGTIELLNYLQDRGVTLGVVSNSDPRLHDILKNLDMDAYFEFVLTSYEAGVAKPDVKIFEKAMEMSKLVKLQNRQCLHIGDNFKLDYFGAKNSGWNSFLVLHKQLNGNGSNVNDMFQNLSLLHDYLKQYWNFNTVK